MSSTEFSHLRVVIAIIGVLTWIVVGSLVLRAVHWTDSFGAKAILGYVLLGLGGGEILRRALKRDQ
jgi:hypothetical protein